MPTVSVTSRGQVTLRKEYLALLGVEQGGKLDIQVEGNKLTLQPVRKTGKFEDFFGCLKGKTNGVVLTIEEINEAIAQAAADEVMESFNR